MKINCEFDTVTKQLTLNVDGVAVDSIDTVSFSKTYSDDDTVKYCARVCKCSEDKINKTSKTEVVYASQSEAQPKVKISVKHLKA